MIWGRFAVVALPALLRLPPRQRAVILGVAVVLSALVIVLLLLMDTKTTVPATSTPDS